MIEPAAKDGRTGFIDAIAAYERLPTTLKQRIATLEVVYHFEGRQEMNRFGFQKDLKVWNAHPMPREPMRNSSSIFLRWSIRW